MKSLLNEAMEEVRTLRVRNQLLQARCDMFDSCMLMFNTEPNYQRQVMSVDIVWKMQKAHDSLLDSGRTTPPPGLGPT
jgi:hypothetical protein